MNKLTTKAKAKVAPKENGPFDFKRCPIIPSSGSLHIAPAGGPFCLVTVEMYDAKDKLVGGTELVGDGAPWSSLDKGKVEWPIEAGGCKGGVLKWMIVPMVGAGGLRPYVITAQLWQNGMLLGEAVYKGTIADGATVGTPFIDGVLIS